MTTQVTTRSCNLASVEETRALGQKLGELARPGDVILLVGQLGAGKTAFTQGLAAGLGIGQQVNSPTFVLLKEYVGRLKLYHFDLYRLNNIEATVRQEWAEFLYGDGISVVEWADLAAGILPPEHLLIEFDITSDTQRRVRLSGVGERYRELAALPQLCS